DEVLVVRALRAAVGVEAEPDLHVVSQAAAVFDAAGDAVEVLPRDRIELEIVLEQVALGPGEEAAGADIETTRRRRGREHRQHAQRQDADPSCHWMPSPCQAAWAASEARGSRKSATLTTTEIPMLLPSPAGLRAETPSFPEDGSCLKGGQNRLL